jgi:hypothetical protein
LGIGDLAVTKIINLYCEGMILHVHKDKTDELNLQSVARDFCFREYRQNIFGQMSTFYYYHWVDTTGV